MTSGVSIPSTMYKSRYRRSKDNNFKWYLILAISIVFIVLAVTVIALTIYLTSQNELKDTKEMKSNMISGNGGPRTTLTPQTTTTENQPPTGSTTDQKQTSSNTQPQPTSVQTSVATPKIVTLVPGTTSAPTSKKAVQSTEIKTVSPTTESPITQTQNTQSPTTKLATTQAPTTQSPTTKLVTSQAPTTQSPSTKLATTQAPTTQSPTTKLATTQAPTTQSPTTKSTTTQAPTTQPPTTQSPTTQTSAIPTSFSSSSTPVVSSEQSTDNTISPTTSTFQQTTQPIVSDSLSTTNISSTSQTPITDGKSNGVIRVTGSDISSSSPFLLTCEVSDVPGWIDLQIYRHYGSNQSGLVAQMTAGAIVPTVIVIDDTLTFSANHKTDSLTMVLIGQTFDCNRAGTYSCAVTSASIVIKDKTDVKVANKPPEILVPMTIVEGRTMSLDCIVEFKGTGGDIKWTFSPPGLSDTFYDLSIDPDTKNSSTSCTSKLESKLTFTPGMYDNGSNFRCEVVNQQGYNGTTVLQTTIPFLVIGDTFCLNKDFTIHNHPYQPCGKIVYCSDIGPIVYEIGCPTVGYCYDAVKTQCVPEDDLGV